MVNMNYESHKLVLVGLVKQVWEQVIRQREYVVVIFIVKGVILGGSWVSSADSVAKWAPFLRQLNLLDQNNFQEYHRLPNQ